MDCWRDRLPPLEENLARFRLLTLAKVIHGDARRITVNDLDVRKFDRILLDVPCSNTGVQRRRADSRWRFSAERLQTLNETQLMILENASELLAPGGRIVYSTCSLEEEENEGIISEFIRRHPKFQIVDKVFIVPPEKQMDGAFAAALENKW